jgi:hypothetical protein
MKFKINLNIVFFITSLIIIVSCSAKDDSLEMKNKTFNLSENIIISSKSDETINFDFGIWMFNRERADVNAIANWINIKKDGKIILEPINILWIDYRANNQVETIKNITDFLHSNNIMNRNGSSTGYYGLFDNNNWIPQHQETWSNMENPLTTNNHGRVFLAHKVMSNLQNPVFISSGAFSIESEKHYLISFNDALEQMKEINEWKIFDNRYKTRNIIVTDNYTTFDHNGIKIFILD